MTRMGFFGEAFCFLLLYSLSVIQIPIGIAGGLVQLVRSLFDSDGEKRQKRIASAKTFFISAIPVVGPAIALNRIMDKK